MAAGRRSPVFVELQTHGAGFELLAEGGGDEEFPLPRNPRFMGMAPPLEHALDVSTRRGNRSWRLVPVAGPVPPPIIVVMPAAMASSIC